MICDKCSDKHEELKAIAEKMAVALKNIESGLWTSKIYGLQKAGRGIMMDIAGKALTEYNKYKGE